MPVLRTSLKGVAVASLLTMVLAAGGGLAAQSSPPEARAQVDKIFAR